MGVDIHEASGAGAYQGVYSRGNVLIHIDTIEKFVEACEAYYGVYPDIVRDMLEMWLRSQRVAGHELRAIFGQVVQTLEQRYKTPPDVATLKPMLMRIREDAEHRRLEESTKHLLPDPADCVERRDAKEFVAAILTAMSEGRDPREDATVKSQLEKYDVLDLVDQKKVVGGDDED